MNRLKFIYISTIFSIFCFKTLADQAISSNAAILSHDTEKSSHIQQIHSYDAKINFFEQNRDLIVKFAKQPQFTKTSIKCFFRHTFNNPYYADKYLPFDLSHMLTFSSFAAQTANPREYLCNVISIYKQKIFFSRFINGFEFEDFLKKFIPIIEPYLDKTSETKETIEKIKEKLYLFLYNDFDKLKSNPDKILEETALAIHSLYSKQQSEDNLDISIDELQYVLFNFLQLCLSKLIWNPKEHDFLWLSIKSVSSMLEECLQKKILSSNTHLNELLWNQLASFSYLLENWGTILPESFYDNLIDEINTKQNSLWSLKEQDPLVLSKFRHLNYMLNQGKMRSQLHKNSKLLVPILPDNSGL